MGKRPSFMSTSTGEIRDQRQNGTRILGIDPGSRLTGFGIIHCAKRLEYISSGVIQTGAGTLDSVLRIIFEGIREVIENHAPDEIVVEKVFVSRNVSSALKLGQARGAAICAAAMSGRPFHEYSATQIKQSVVGNGRADKAQVQHMVRYLLNLSSSPAADAADALATAICHHYLGGGAARIGRLAAAKQPVGDR